MKTPQDLDKIYNKLPKEKTELATQKIELGLVDEVKKAASNIESDWKDALKIAVDGAKELKGKVDAKSKILNKSITALSDGIDKAENLLKELGIGNNGEIEKAKKELKIAYGQRKELTGIARRLNNIY